MTKPNNHKLTPHFTLFEYVEGTLPQRAIDLNWKNIAQCDLNKAILLLQKIEQVRADINANFVTDNPQGGEIGLNITSGWRCKEWELLQGRSGNGQHPIAAVDVVPSNVSKKLSGEIMAYLEKKYWRTWGGGFAIKKPTSITTGFAHFDNRADKARWYY